MKKQLIFLPFIMFLMNANTSQCQEIKRINISEFYLIPSTIIFSPNSLNIIEIERLAKNSSLLSNTNNFAGFDNNSYNGMNGNTSFSLLLGFNISDKGKSEILNNPHFRLGFTYGKNSLVSGFFSNEQIFIVDTLISQNSNRETFVDSTVTDNYFVNYETENIRIDASVLFRRNPEKRWSVFVGMGIMAGFSVQANTQINYQRYSRFNYRYENTSNRINDEILEYNNEKFENKTSFSLAAYVPFGVNFRIGNKREFWKHTHLYYEMRPGLMFTDIPEIGSFTNTFLQQGFGLKFTW